MKNIYSILSFISLIILTRIEYSNAQCAGVDSLIYDFNNPNGVGGYAGYLCTSTDSVGTVGSNGYYDGDGYKIKLVMGSQVTFSVDSCNGIPVSLTITDSSNNIIPGAYAVPACPNSLNFTAPYTGAYVVVINVNGICNGAGTTLLGEAYAQIQSGTTPPVCPDANVINDTICGATELIPDSPFVHGNTSIAFLTDPLDGYIISIGYTCSPPNNTLWYSFTAPFNIDTINVILTSDSGSNFHSWLAVFAANNINGPCNGGLAFIGCVDGPDDNAGIDTVVIPFYGLLSGHTYFFMIDGYNGSTGGFSIALQYLSIPDYIRPVFEKNNLLVFPNPATNKINIKTEITEIATVTIFNSVGQELFKTKFNNLLNEEIDISKLPDGIYTLKIDCKGSTYRNKVVINK